MKNGKVIFLEVVGTAVLVGAAVELGATVVRRLVEATKSSPDFGDDYEDSYQAGVEAHEASAKEETKYLSAFHTVDSLKDVALELIQALRVSNQDLIDLHAELIDHIIGGSGYEGCRGCRSCGSCDDQESDEYETCDECESCDDCGSCSCHERKNHGAVEDIDE